MRDAGANTPEENRKDSERLDRLFNGLWSHPCFTIGAIQGVALGGGAGLIACLDYVVATENVRIALSEGKLGILLPSLVPTCTVVLVQQLPPIVHASQSSQVQEALRVGFIERVVENVEAFDDEIDSIIAEVLTTGPSAATLAKELTLGFDRWNDDDESLRRWTLDFTSRMRGSREGQEGLSSFLEKRQANWKPDE